MKLSALIFAAVGLVACGPDAAPPAPSPTFTVAAGDWSVRYEQNGTFTVSCRGAPVLESTFVIWGPNWGWAEWESSVGAPQDGVVPLRGKVASLGLAIEGDITIRGTKVHGTTVELRLSLQAERDLRGIIGGGLEWRFRRDSRALGGNAPAPTLSKDRSGWRWEPAAGSALEVAFSEPCAKVNFENAERAVRTMFVGAALDAGKHEIKLTLSLPRGTRVETSLAERYGQPDVSQWWSGVLPHDAAPVDLSFLNHVPAGKHGFVKVAGDRLEFADGTPARFFGGNLAAYALFADPAQFEAQARRMAQLGFNLMRIHHHDSMGWVEPTVIDRGKPDSQQFDAAGLDRVDRWVKALRDAGIYVWLDVHVGRVFKRGDGIEGFSELERTNGEGKGFCYLNDRVRDLMAEFQAKWLGHVNPYTKLAYKDDPGVMGVLVTNENDLTHHFGHAMLPDKGNPHHQRLFETAARAFAKAGKLPYDRVTRTWEPGPAKIFLNDVEHRFAKFMVDQARELGVRVPIATTNYWGDSWLSSLPALTAGSVIDVHSYGDAEALSVDPRYGANFLTPIASARVDGMPLTITEWNVPYPIVDRCTAPLYLASVAALQGWDAPMLYNYSQTGFGGPTHADQWSTFYDPAITGVIPAAALLYRRGDVREATKRYCVMLDRAALYESALSPAQATAVATLVEQSRVSVGLPDLPELTWDRASKPGSGVTLVRDVGRSFLGDKATEVVSDTGELRRDFVGGVQVIDTPRTQAVNGWQGGGERATHDARFAITTPKACVVLSSLDGEPLRTSKRILVTAVGRAVAAADGRMPFRSEPVLGRIDVRTAHAGLTFVPLRGDGTRGEARRLVATKGEVGIVLDAALGTHWAVLEAR